MNLQVFQGDCRDTLPYLTIRRTVACCVSGHAHKAGTAFKPQDRVQAGPTLEECEAVVEKGLVGKRVPYQTKECFRNCGTRRSYGKRNSFLDHQAWYSNAQNDGSASAETLGRCWRAKPDVWETRCTKHKLERWTNPVEAAHLREARMETVCSGSVCERQVLPIVRLKRENGDSPYRPIQSVPASSDGHRECLGSVS